MAKAAEAFHAYDEKLARHVAYSVDDNVPDHVAVAVDPSVLKGKLPERPADDDPEVTLRQSQIDALVADAAGEKQFTQADLDLTAEEARKDEREIVLAELAELAESEPQDGDAPADPAADTPPADTEKDKPAPTGSRRK